jgi:hypothetical protein
MAAKWVEFDLHIKQDGTAVAEVTARQEGADCRVVAKHAAQLGTIVGDETTGPFCDRVSEITGQR